MSLLHFFRRRPEWLRGINCVLLAVLVLACLPCPIAAAAVEVDPSVATPALGHVIFADFFSKMGDRTRMIQVGCIFVAIGIFVLTRSYR